MKLEKPILFLNTEDLDAKYFIWSLLMIIRPFFGWEITSFDYVLASVFFLFVFLNIGRPKELFFLFLMAFFSRIYSWLSIFPIIQSGGTRVLLLDVFLLILFGTGFVLIYYRKHLKIRRFHLFSIFFVLFLIWGTNYLSGFLNGQFGAAIGEGRLYVSSILLLLIVSFFYDHPEQAIRKSLQIISLCSLIISVHVILIAVGLSEPANYGEDVYRRFNPGSRLVVSIVFGLIISFVDYIYKKDYHILKVNKPLLIGFYVIIIFITGVRAMTIITVLVLGYFLIVNQQFNLGKKLIFLFTLGILTVGALQLNSVQRVLSTQTDYTRSANTSSTFLWRVQMWEIFFKHISQDNKRLLWGRPFGEELIDVRELKWRHGSSAAGVVKVDNSLAHNDFISIAVTNGVVFSSLLLLLIILYIMKGFANRKNIRFGPLLLIFTWFLICQTLQSATNAEAKHYGQSLTLWIHLGFLALIFLKMNKEDPKIEDTPSHQT